MMATKEDGKKVKKGKKSKGSNNQLAKSLDRLQKITALGALAKRAAGWAKLEPQAENKEKLAFLEAAAAQAESLRLSIMMTIGNLVSNGYTPPQKSSSGELKFEPGRPVWIRPKYLQVYKEGGFTDDVLGQLHIVTVVQGRVFLSVGKLDPNAETHPPLIPVPKIHVTSAAPSAQGA